MTQHPNFKDVEQGDEVTITLDSGESFTGLISEREYDQADLTQGYISLSFEGGFWDQVKDRVDDEVLQIRQDLARKTGDPKEPALTGTIWVGEDIEASTPEYKEIGVIVSLEKH